MNLSRKKQNAATAQSSNTSKAAVSVPSDQAMLTVSARACRYVVITVTADDGNGGRVSDAFTVTVEGSPVVVTAISDVTNLAAGEMRGISLSGAFKDPDGDDWWVSQVEMSDLGVVWAWPSADSLTLTVEGHRCDTRRKRVRQSLTAPRCYSWRPVSRHP
ncbi:MAG: hypothetical protein OXF79_24055 [Chloroflexi bacterium]|nr:hypothetical protein [Chloroflexota bacterium]